MCDPKRTQSSKPAIPSENRELVTVPHLFSNALDSLLEGVQIIGFDWVYLYVNDAVTKHGKKSKSDLLGRTMMECYPGIENTELFSKLRRCMEDRTHQTMLNPFEYPDRSVGWFELRISPVPEGIFILSLDISERKHAELEVKRINRVLRILSNCNQHLIRSTTEKDFLTDLCRIIVEDGGYGFAWVGLAEDDPLCTVAPVAMVGPEQHAEHIRQTRISWSEERCDECLAARAIHSGQTMRNADLGAAENHAQCIESAVNLGLMSTISLPIMIENRAAGALTIYSRTRDDFQDAEEIKLLEELAGDLAFGIAARRTAQAHQWVAQSLGKSEAQFRILVDSVRDYALIMLDATGKVVSWNAGAERFKGYHAEEIIGQDFSCFYTPEDIASGKPGQELAIARDQGRMEDEGWRVRKGGARFWANVIITRIDDAQGLLVGYAKITRDITERKAVEQALVESERKLSEAQNMAQLGYWDWDVKTGQVVWSEQVFKIFQLDPKMFTPQIDSILAFSPWPEDRTRDLELIQRAMESHETGSYEQRFLRPDNSIGYYVSTFQGKYGEDGQPTAIVGTVLDITERKQIEVELKSLNENLERSNKELEQFAYVASHDLQEPLRMVSSFTQLLAQRYGNQLDKDAKEFIEFAVDGANRMQRMIQDLLTYSRVGTRGKPLTAVDSHTVLGQAIANLGAAIDEAHALVTTDDLPTILADEGQLTQLFQNLIANGIKFQQPDATPRVHVSACKEGVEWVFSVRDNGIGIAKEFQPRLFVIFQRLHGRGEYPGTGIGLAICKRIVERHQGRIWLESAPNQGTTFFFSIPALPKEQHYDQ